MLQVEALSKSYGNTKALSEVSFTVLAGEVFGFLGPNGAGKTTTMNIVAGLLAFDSGHVTIDGVDLESQRSGLQGMVGYLPESPTFYGYMSALEYLRFIGRIGGLAPQANHTRAQELLRIVGLEEAATKKIGGFSRGMRQRLGIATAIYHRPRLLLLDEPTSALDPQGRLDIMALIKRMREVGMTVFLSTHILADVERVCDSVAIIKNGTLVVADGVDHLRQRFMQPVVDVIFDRPLPAIPEAIAESPHVEASSIEGETVSVMMADLETGKRELLRTLADLDCSVISVSVRQPSLEDIFVRLVK